MNETILYQMPRNFTRREFVTEVIKAGRLPGRADQLLERGTLTGLLTRTERGHYQRNTEFEHKQNEEKI